MHSYPLIHLITILNKSVMQSRHRRLVLSTPVPAFVLEDFNLCYPSAPLQCLVLNTCDLPVYSTLATFSHSSALYCPDQDHHSSIAFHSNITC